MESAFSRGGNVSDVACVSEQVLRLATTRSRVAEGTIRSWFLGADSQSPPGGERNLGLSTHVHSVATGSRGIDWYPAGATVHAKCGIVGRSEETATLPETGPNRPKGPRFVATRVLGAAAEPGMGH